MAEPKKLPSGNWRCQANYTDEFGKYRKKSFTAKTKAEARHMADEFLLRYKHDKLPENKTLKQLSEEYLEKVTAVLSPSTLGGYRKIVNNSLNDLTDVRVGFITKDMYQKSINNYAKEHAPQTVKNVHSFFSKVLTEQNIHITDDIMFPQKVKKEMSIPTSEEVKKLITYCEGTRLELLVKFAAYLGLRKSEIIAIKWEDIDLDNKTVSINKARVKNEYKEFVEKSPKTYNGTRTLKLPDVLISALPPRGNAEEYVINDSPAALESMYKRVLRKLELPYTFHALRHYYASVMLLSGVPNRYAKEKMGHATENMLMNVYQHTFKEAHSEIDNTMNEYFNNLMGIEETK